MTVVRVLLQQTLGDKEKTPCGVGVLDMLSGSLNTLFLLKTASQIKI